ncbi:MAG: hypothetical protein P8Y26_12500 [Gemmatimonadales bacterium]
MRTKLLGNEQGAAIIQVAVGLAILLGMGALAVDVGMLYNAADAAALAGASAFIDFPVTMATDPARQRALQYALANGTFRTPISAGQVDIQVLPAEEKVRVRVDGTANTFFARILDVDLVDVAALAAAEAAVGAVQAVCVKPLAIPDRWLDVDDDDGNRIWDEPESWVYDAYGSPRARAARIRIEPTSATATRRRSRWTGNTKRKTVTWKGRPTRV